MGGDYLDEKDFVLSKIYRVLNLSRVSFKFANDLFVFIHCHLAVGNVTNPGPKRRRRRREVDDDVTNVHPLAEDPLLLAQEKPEEKFGKDLDKSGM